MKFKTGIVSLDAQLNGGFPKSSVILILEDPGAGGDVFSFHFAVEGVKNNERVLYIATDDTEEEIRENIRLYFPEDYVEKIEVVSLVISELKERDIRKYLRNTMYDPIRYVISIITSNNFDRVVVNNLTYFISNYEFKDVLTLMENFSKCAKRDDSVYLLLMTKGMFDSKVETAMKHHSDGVIELTLKEEGNEIQRMLKFIKFKRIFVPKAIMRYDLTDKGIRVESVMRIV